MFPQVTVQCIERGAVLKVVWRYANVMCATRPLCSHTQRSVSTKHDCLHHPSTYEDLFKQIVSTTDAQLERQATEHAAAMVSTHVARLTLVAVTGESVAPMMTRACVGGRGWSE